MDTKIISQIYKLRNNFILIGLTGRTGSGCSTVANILADENILSYNSEFKKVNDKQINNDVRKNKIIHNYIHNNWNAFTKITASNVIFYFVLKDLEFNQFKNEYFSDDLKDVEDLKEQYDILSNKCKDCENYFSKNIYSDNEENNLYIKLITEDISNFRMDINSLNSNLNKDSKYKVLQQWGNNIRKSDSIDSSINTSPKSPSCLAFKINQFIKIIRKINGENPTHIVIDSLRSPYEILYFRERYSSFYCFSVNTTNIIRFQQLINQGYSKGQIDELDKGENSNGDSVNTYKDLNVDNCIELSDVHLAHNGKKINENRELINQIFTYISLIKHPGLISPSPIERLMQIAFTAKLNSGCLSRQVGAVVTDKNFSIKSIGWNTSAQGQTPCTLRCLNDLNDGEDENAYSEFEKNDDKFKSFVKVLMSKYESKVYELNGLPLAYCFKDVYTTVDNQQNNQVHTRSLHAEESAFLQLAKYGSQGINGGKLFTTASPCELCAKKAYQLGIKEIYYIDSYPGISMRHILDVGDNKPSVFLFHGAIGRAYVQLFNPLISLKDEIKAYTEVDVKNKSEYEKPKTNK